MAEDSEKDADFFLGEEVMDGEHAAQVRLLEAFQEGLVAGKPHDDLVIILDRLVEFTNLHFMSEELLMREHAYPGLAGHAQEHEALRDQLRAMRNGFNAGDQTVAGLELERLRTWLIDHIKTKDRAFVSTLEQSGGEKR